jgi:HAD superfamily hydrolase (TIGR01509 family)
MIRRVGLFIDLDGTLAASLGVLHSTYEEFLRRFGRAATAEEFDSLNGPPLRTVVGRLKATHSLPGTEADLYALYIDLLAVEYDGVAPHDGAESLLRAAHEVGQRVGVVTSGSQALAGRWLARVGLRGWVDEVVGFERGGRGKPHPDPYLYALEALDCSAASSLAVEDSFQGATSAVAAGLRTLVVAREPARSADWPGVHASVRGLRDVQNYLERGR